MSDHNEDKAKPDEAKSNSRQSKALPKKRSKPRSRKPSETTVDSRKEVKETGQSPAAPPATEKPVSSDAPSPSERKQPARRPAKKQTRSRQTQTSDSQNDSDSDGKTTDEGPSSAKDSSGPERSQSARRPAKRKSDSNRRRSGSSSRYSSRNNRPNQSNQSNRPKPTLRLPPVNPEELQSKAWELYRADVNEESTAMFNEEEASDLVRRSFILADIFLRFRDQLFDSGSDTENTTPDSTEDSPS